MTSLVDFWGQGSTGSRYLFKTHSRNMSFWLFSFKNIHLEEQFFVSSIVWLILFSETLCFLSCSHYSFECQWKSNKKRNFLQKLILRQSLLPVDPCPQKSTLRCHTNIIEKYKRVISKLFWPHCAPESQCEKAQLRVPGSAIWSLRGKMWHPTSLTTFPALNTADFQSGRSRQVLHTLGLT